ncbi:MAG: archaellin/type IV pilin N-terminal domain-containing protein [Zestosphaera sp.]
MKLNKAISPILATVILIAVTLVIAIGVIGWIMGIWGTFGATETIQVFADSYINASDKELRLHIKNAGTASAVIYKIEVLGLTTIATEYTLTPGNETTLSVSLGNVSPVPGTSYQIKIYTKAGNVYPATIIAR